MNRSRFRLYAGLPREIYLLFAARIINTVGSFITPLFALILTQKIGMTASEAGSFTTFVCLTQAPCLLLGGKLVDSVGRKRMILIADTLGAFFYISCAFVPPGRLMADLILIASDLYVVAWPAFDAITADLTVGEARKHAFSLLYLGANLGFAIGPIFGGLLFNRYLPLLFFFDGLTTLLSTALILFIPETKRAPSPAGVPEGGAAGTADKTHTLRVLWQCPALFAFLLISLLYHFTYAQYGFTLPLQMNALYGESGPRLYSTLVTVNGLVVILFTPLFTKWASRFRSLRAVAYGGILFFLSFVLFSLSRRLPVFYSAIILFTFGEILHTIHTGVFIADSTPTTHRGRVNSASSLIRGTGYALGPAVMGNILQETSYFTAWMVIAGLMLLGFALMFALDGAVRRRQNRLARTETPDGAGAE